MYPSKLQAIERGLLQADKLLVHAGISRPAKSQSSPLTGIVILEYFEPSSDKCHTYRRCHGEAPFRNLVRSFPPFGEEWALVKNALEALTDLQDFLEEQLGLSLPENPTVTDDYLQDLLLQDIASWPDNLYFDYKIDLREVRDNFASGDGRFCDLTTIWQHDIPPRTALKSAIDLVCICPWLGIPLDGIIPALHRLKQDLDLRRSSITPPLMDCVVPGKTWSFRHPLWHDGFQGFLFAAIGGDLNTLQTEPDQLANQLRRVSDIIASALSEDRYRKAGFFISSAREDNADNYLIGLAEAVQHIVSPHRLIHASVNGQQCFSPDTEESIHCPQLAMPVPETDDTWFEQPLAIDLQHGGHEFSFEVKLANQAPMFDEAIESICIRNRIENIVHHFANSSAKAKINGHGQSTDEDIYKSVSRKLSGFKNCEVSIRDYLLCFVSLSILNKRPMQTYQITGTSVAKLQLALDSDWGIRRRSSNDNQRNGCRPLHISQMVNGDDSLKAIEAELGGVRLEKSRGALNVSIVI